MKRIFLALGVLSPGALDLSAEVLLSEDFSYPDGALVVVSAGTWATHSGTAGEADVTGGKLNLTQTDSEDVNALLAGQPYTPTGGTNLYVSFTANFSALPGGTAYFAHFRDTNIAFRCRIFATTNGAAAGAFRIGVTADSGVLNPADIWNADLNLDTEYRIVCRLVMSDMTSTLWVDPAAETDASLTTPDTAALAIVTSFAFRQPAQNSGMGTLTVDDLLVGTTFADVVGGDGGSGPPVITAQPQNLTVTEGDNATLIVGAIGTPPLSFQWKFNGADMNGETNNSLTLTAVTTNQAGTYSVTVTNSLGLTNSDPATLTVQPRPVGTFTNIAHLRTLVDNVNYLPTDTTTLFQVEGVVTTYTNLTTAGNALFYIQDSTAGIAVFVSGGGTIRPAAGDLVRVTGPLGHFNGLLELNLAASNADHSVVTVNTGNALPAPTLLEFGWQNDPAIIEPHEGRYMVVSNVFLDLSSGSTFTSGSNVNMTNQTGETFALRIDARVADIIGQAKPTTPVTLYGVLAQFDTADPRTTGYQLLPSRFADIVGPRLPIVAFTNTLENLTRPGDSPTSTAFTEYALRPGEKITIATVSSDSQGRAVTVQPQTAGLPAGAVWFFFGQPGTNVPATFTFTPGAADAGVNYPVTLLAINEEGTNVATWNIHVPTAVEQRVIISEFLANPTADTNAPYYNPLRRDTPSIPDRITAEDEYLELVNLSAGTVDLAGWTISDAVGVRHTFFGGDSITSSNAVIVYGGRLFGSVPNLPAGVTGFAATESTNGLALNNAGDTIVVRNGNGWIVERVVYGNTSMNAGSLARNPDSNSDFFVHSTVATTAVSPGTQNDGRLFSEPAVSAPIQVSASLGAGPSVVLRWNAEAGRTYSVLKTEMIGVAFTSLATGLSFAASLGEFADTNLVSVGTRFYQISSP